MSIIDPNDDTLRLNGVFDPTVAGGPNERDLDFGLATDHKAGLIHFRFTRSDKVTAAHIAHFAIDGPSAGKLAINLIMRLDPKTVAKIALGLMNGAFNNMFGLKPRIIVPSHWDPKKN